jgi:hypothetical protein
MTKKDLDSVTTFEQAGNNAQGAIKLLTLKVTDIARAEDARHFSSTAYTIANYRAALEMRERSLIDELTFYRGRKAVAERDYKLDCSGFDSAVRHLVPRNYWELIETKK